MAPARLTPPPGGEAEPRVGLVLRVRAWADAGYRREHVGWSSNVARVVQSASDYLARRFHVRLELVDAQPWDRAGSDDKLDSILVELEHHDDGRDADLVIGLTSSLPVFERSIHTLGMARYYGRHFVLRGAHDARERAVVETWRNNDVFSGDSDDDVEHVYAARVRHREVVVLLHELGHALGLLHVADVRDIMNPAATIEQSEIDPTNGRLFELSLEQLLRARGKRETSFAEIITHVEGMTGPRWSEAERTALLETLRRFEREGARLPERADRAKEATARGAREGARESATESASGGATEGAGTSKSEGDPAPEPGIAEMTRCAERINNPSLGAPREICARAMKLRPDDPFAALNLANAELRNRDDARFAEALAEGMRRLERNGTPESWAYHASLCLSANRLTEALEAANRAGAAGHATKKQVEELIDVMGLEGGERRSGVSRRQEPDYVRRVKRIEELLGRNARNVGTELAEALRLYPRSALLWTAECGRHMAAGSPSAAENACKRALEANEGLWRAHFMMALVASARGRGAQSIDHANRARALKPAAKMPWVLLAQELRRAGRHKELSDLDESHRARFGQPLPPTK